MIYTTTQGRIWGQIPATAGRIFWVAPSDGYTVNGQPHRASDENDGLAADRALRTVGRAWALCAANVGDVIMLLPGSHTSIAITANIAGVTMMGLPGGAGNPWRQRTSLTTGAGTLLTASAADIEIAYLNLVPVTTAITVSAAASHGLHIHHCYWDMNTAAASTSTRGLVSSSAPSRMHIHHCVFDSDGAQGNALAMVGSLDCVIEDNVFSLSAGTWASVMTMGAAVDRCLVRRNTFSCAGTAITVAVNGAAATLATGVLCHDNRFSSLVTVPIDGFDASECEISENFSAGVGGGAGGALITAIT